MGNVLQTANVVRLAWPAGMTDTIIGYLDAPITNVTPASVLSAQIPGLLRRDLRLDQQVGLYAPACRAFALHSRSPGQAWDWVRRVVSVNLGADNGSSLSLMTQVTAAGPVAGPSDTNAQSSWPDVASGGDSGSQVFTKLGGKTVLLMQYYTATSGGNYCGAASRINTAMNACKDAGDATVYAVDQVVA
jgi:hypothetical protein